MGNLRGRFDSHPGARLAEECGGEIGGSPNIFCRIPETFFWKFSCSILFRFPGAYPKMLLKQRASAEPPRYFVRVLNLEKKLSAPRGGTAFFFARST